ncbi:hypothetical protein SNOG_15922 [Parastagonospora nodorum SN15]|uniref:2EXR domain-containing protein n=1 Tax=Phaeosphaeria nodorum (strain SN15 / ATCC MYA-4574 / FGSC 10173) TaxID=321614 RepID=Q0TXB0_PHANO|nr:hypothetical protein SNOG_15922 [Parastagonospora nodorum SN15]EAT76760.1 hypothetical protein SNOG_15922 [Parastagonospora nodorum SN15]
MSTFHPFPRLPTELRLQIWEMTVEPRTVEICIRFTDFPSTPLADGKQKRPPRQMSTVQSPTPVPGPLQACREARYHGFLSRTIPRLKFAKHSRKGDRQPRTGQEFEHLPCFVKLKDVYVDIGDHEFEYW